MQINNKSLSKIPQYTQNISFGTRQNNSQLKKEADEKFSLYPNDTEYIKTIAQEINLPENEIYKLKSIIGQQQIEDILNNAQRQNFNPGDIIKHAEQYTETDLKKLAQSGFCLNLHTHTLHSDGKMSVQSLLDQAAQYADIVKAQVGGSSAKPSFVIAITDHDTTQGAQEAVKIIASNPQKYKNLGIVLGAELSAIYKNEEMLAKPFAYEMVAYSINPFDNKLNDFLLNTRTSRINLSKEIIDEANKRYPGIEFSYKEACSTSKNPEKGIDGFLYSLADYFNVKAKHFDKDIDTQDLCLKYLPANTDNGKGITNKAEDLFGYIKNNYGFLGIAHPAKIYLGNGKIKESFIEQCKSENKDTGRVIIQKFISHLQNIGGRKFRAIETNYQSYDGNLKEANEILNGERPEDISKKGTVSWINQFREYAKQLSLLEAGGLDTHSENPFLRK